MTTPSNYLGSFIFIVHQIKVGGPAIVLQYIKLLRAVHFSHIPGLLVTTLVSACIRVTASCLNFQKLEMGMTEPPSTPLIQLGFTKIFFNEPEMPF